MEQLRKIKLTNTVVQDVQLSTIGYGQVLGSFYVNDSKLSDIELGNLHVEDLLFERDLSLIGDYTLGVKKPETTDKYVVLSGTTFYNALSDIFTGKPVDFLNFTSLQDGTKMSLVKVGVPCEVSMVSSDDGQHWGVYEVGSTYEFPSIGSKFYLKKDSSDKDYSFSTSTTAYYKLSATGLISADGNVRWLADSTGNRTELDPYCFANLFSRCTALINAPAVLDEIPSIGCYSSMFYNCTQLTSAPKLPATYLSSSCYQSMFAGCTSLSTPPALDGFSLDNRCYFQMFDGCTALTSAPKLPSTNAKQECYSAMFRGCCNLSVPPVVNITQVDKDCFRWMFANCNALQSSPVLCSEQLCADCYKEMFMNCTSLSSIITKQKQIGAEYTNAWLKGAREGGTLCCNSTLYDILTSASEEERNISSIPMSWQLLSVF